MEPALLHTEDILAASHCGSAPGKLCRWRCDVWSKAGDKHASLVLPASRSDRAVCKKKCSQVFRGGKTQWFKASENWLPMGDSEGGGGREGGSNREREDDTRGTD